MSMAATVQAAAQFVMHIVRPWTHPASSENGRKSVMNSGRW